MSKSRGATALPLKLLGLWSTLPLVRRMVNGPCRSFRALHKSGCKTWGFVRDANSPQAEKCRRYRGFEYTKKTNADVLNITVFKIEFQSLVSQQVIGAIRDVPPPTAPIRFHG